MTLTLDLWTPRTLRGAEAQQCLRLLDDALCGPPGPGLPAGLLRLQWLELPQLRHRGASRPSEVSSARCWALGSRAPGAGGVGNGTGCLPAQTCCPLCLRLTVCPSTPLPHRNVSGETARTCVFQPGPVGLWASHSLSLGLRNPEDHCSTINGPHCLHLTRNHTCVDDMALQTKPVAPPDAQPGTS